MLIPIETYTEGKNKWEIKRDSEDNKWSVFKNGKKLKTSKFFDVVIKEIPLYKVGYIG